MIMILQYLGEWGRKRSIRDKSRSFCPEKDYKPPFTGF